MGKKIILVGPGGSGKDYLRKIYQERGYRFGVTHTSRPKRVGEIDGEDVHFETEEWFQESIKKDLFREWDKFNDWYYGTLKETFEDSEIFTMTPRGISKLTSEERRNCLVIYLDISEEVRRERLLVRGDVDRVERRLEADARDFSGFTNFDIRISNEDF